MERKIEDLGRRHWNFSKRSSKRGIFPIWILSSRINARGSFFPIGKVCRAAARISFVERKARIDR